MSEAGFALVLTAPSGTGKSTLTKKLLNEFPDFQFSISCTTRQPREGEEDGKDYYFLDKQEFEKKIYENYFAEWAEVHGNYYGTPLREIETRLSNGSDMLFDIDIQGASQLSLALPQAHFVFLFPPNLAELEYRLRTRGTDNEEAILRRLNNARSEIKQSHWFDSWIINDDIEKAYAQLKACVVTAKLAPQRHRYFLNTLLTGK